MRRDDAQQAALAFSDPEAPTRAASCGASAPFASVYQIQDHPVAGETRFAEAAEFRIWTYLAPVVGEVSVGATHHPRRVYHPGDFRLTAPGVAIRRVADEEAVIRSVAIAPQVARDALGAPIDRLVSDLAGLQRRAFRSPLIESVAEQLRLTAGGRQPADIAYIEALLHAAAHELRRLAGAAAPTPTGRLGASELRRVNQFIDGSLRDKLRMPDLARFLEMPAPAFQHGLKAATGRTTHQHLTHRRLTVARSLIETTGASLAQIAFETGFTSQSHMTDVFKAKLGATPGQFRAAARPGR